jgi:hypothetical protein
VRTRRLRASSSKGAWAAGGCCKAARRGRWQADLRTRASAVATVVRTCLHQGQPRQQPFEGCPGLRRVALPLLAFTRPARSACPPLPPGHRTWSSCRLCADRTAQVAAAVGGGTRARDQSPKCREVPEQRPGIQDRCDPLRAHIRRSIVSLRCVCSLRRSWQARRSGMFGTKRSEYPARQHQSTPVVASANECGHALSSIPESWCRCSLSFQCY